MNIAATIGHNRAPVEPDDALSGYGDAIAEAQNWLDGTPVENEEQMNVIDGLLKEIRSAGTALEAARKDATTPLHDAWKAENARWKVYTDDIERIKKGLAALVDPFKRKLAAEKEAARRAAYEEAERLRREAEEAARTAEASNIDAARDAAALEQQAQDAKARAAEIAKDKVKGLRTVTRYEVTDYSDLLRWMNKNARADLEAAADDYMRRHHKDGVTRPGVRVWQEKEAF